MKRIIKNLTLVSITILILSACANIYQTPDAIPLAKTHRTIAILPPTISIAAGKKTDVEAIKEQQKTESLNFQKEMYAWMLKRKMQGKIYQEILDIETTNSKLLKAGYPSNPLTPAELCSILNVEGVISSNYAMSKPMSDGAAIALLILTGGGGATNEVRASISINDCNNKKLIWNYEHKYSGGIGSSPAKLVEGLMRNASKKMPYIIEK
jgi:hypothetical protein